MTEVIKQENLDLDLTLDKNGVQILSGDEGVYLEKSSIPALIEVLQKMIEKP